MDAKEYLNALQRAEDAVNTLTISGEAEWCIQRKALYAISDARGMVDALMRPAPATADLQADNSRLSERVAVLKRQVASTMDLIGGLYHDITTVAPSEDFHRGYNQAIIDSTNLVQKVLLQVQGVHGRDGLCFGAGERALSRTPLMSETTNEQGSR